MQAPLASSERAEFEREQNARMLAGTRLVDAIGIAAFVGFAFVDPFLVSGPLLPVLFARALIVAVLSTLLGASFVIREPGRHAGMLGLLVGISVGIGVIVVTVMTGGGVTRYHDALALTFFGYACFIFTKPRITITLFVSLVLFYDIAMLTLSTTGPLPTFATNNAVLCLAALLSAGLNVWGHQLRWSEFRSRFELKQAHAKLLELDTTKNQFFANISHELRTPITLMIAPVEALLDDSGALSEQQTHQLQIARRNSLKLLRLVDDLLELTRLEANRVRLRLQSVPLRAFLGQLVEEVQPLALRKNIELRFRNDAADDLELNLDPFQVERVVLNLLANALKFTPNEGNIEVSLADSPAGVAILVRDSGEGIPAEDLALVFERFYQVERSSTRRHGGTGIGLALCKSLVELHGGRIWAESVVGQGTTVHVTLPRMLVVPTASVERRLQPSASGIERRASEQGLQEWHSDLRNRQEYRLLHVNEVTDRRAGGRIDGEKRARTVLVVDDNPEMLQLVSSILSAQYVVVSAQNGDEGLRAAQKYRPDIILSDVMMPVMNGLAMTAALRAEATLAAIPVILMTAQDEVADDVRDALVTAMIAKPFRPDDLRTMVRKNLRPQIDHSAPAAVSANDELPLVLVVEDNDEVRETVVAALQHHFRVVAVGSASEALRLASAEPPSLILSDLMMPEMDGLELCRRLRKDSALSSVPFILLTARAGTEEVTSGLEGGADDYIVKPFNPRELIARIKAQLRARETLATLDERESRLAAIGQAASSVAHDLNSPLQAILGHAQVALQIIQGAASPEEAREDLQAIIDATQRSQHMTHSVLEFVRSGAEIMSKEETDLGELLAQIVHDIGPEMRAVGIETTLAVDNEPPMVLPLDRMRMRRTVENLLRNARDAVSSSKGQSPEPPHIWVRAYSDGSSVVLRVADNGPGIPPQVREQLFQPFASAGKANGTGLGLAIVRNVVLAHDGVISADIAPPEKGAAFEIKLPRVLVRAASAALVSPIGPSS